MPDFRLVNNGYANAALGDGDLTSIFKNLKNLRTDAYVDFELVAKGHVAIETIRDVNQLTGGSFKDFLAMNFDSGKGPLADLVRDVVHFLNGRCGHTTVTTAVHIHENKLRSVARERKGNYSPSVRTGGGGESFLQDGYNVYDYDLYRLLAGVGPAYVGRMFLLLGGDTYYV